MAILDYIIWNGNPEIFSVKSFALRWYGLFFAVGFLVSQQILYYMYRKEGKPEKDVETLTIYMVVATIIGARLGHVIFYDPQIFWENPLGVFLPFEFKPFRFTGLQGLASHGAAIGILFALWLYSRKKKPGQNYLQILDRIVILVALTGALIRFGNFFNSEIIGKPYHGPTSVIFVNGLTQSLEEQKINGIKIVESVDYKIVDSLPKGPNGRVPMDIYIFFNRGINESYATEFVEYDLKALLAKSMSEHFVEEAGPMRYRLTTMKNGSLAAKISTLGIARHPAQLYEAFSSLLLFFLLFYIWYRYKENLRPGLIFGIFLIVLWTLRFAYEFLKEPQESFEETLPLYMGQILSIPLIIAGILVLLYALRNKAPEKK